MLFFYWNCPDSVVLCYFSIGTVLNRKTTKYHTVRTVPTSMKNNKIQSCQDSSNRKITKYHTVRTVPKSMKNNKMCGILLFSMDVGTGLTVWYFVVFLLDFGTVLAVVFCCFSWMLELF
jgi:hypothetical protein